MRNMKLLRTQCREIGPHLRARRKSHGFSRAAAGTWGICSSYGGDGPSKLEFVQRLQDSCLVTRDTSGISSRLDGAIGTLLKVRRETQDPFPFATVILGFLSIFKKGQASLPFEVLNSECLSRCQREERPPVQMVWDQGVSLGSPQGIQTSLHHVRRKSSLPYLFNRSQGISSHLEMIWHARSFPQVAVMNLVFL